MPQIFFYSTCARQRTWSEKNLRHDRNEPPCIHVSILYIFFTVIESYLSIVADFNLPPALGAPVKGDSIRI